MRDPRAIAQTILVGRKRRGLTLKQLSAETDIPYKRLRIWASKGLQEVRGRSKKELQRLADALGVSFEQLWGDDPKTRIAASMEKLSEGQLEELARFAERLTKWDHRPEIRRYREVVLNILERAYEAEQPWHEVEATYRKDVRKRVRRRRSWIEGHLRAGMSIEESAYKFVMDLVGPRVEDAGGNHAHH